jgi:hypothetical protein
MESPVLEWIPLRTFATQVAVAAHLRRGFSLALPPEAVDLVSAVQWPC